MLEGETLHEGVSYSRTSVTCFVDECTHGLSSQVKFLEYAFSQSLQRTFAKLAMTPERRFTELCLDGVMPYCLPSNMEILTFQIKRQRCGNGAVHGAITNTRATHAVISQILNLLISQICYLKPCHS